MPRNLSCDLGDDKVSESPRRPERLPKHQLLVGYNFEQSVCPTVYIMLAFQRTLFLVNSLTGYPA